MFINLSLRLIDFNRHLLKNQNRGHKVPKKHMRYSQSFGNVQLLHCHICEPAIVSHCNGTLLQLKGIVYL